MKFLDFHASDAMAQLRNISDMTNRNGWQIFIWHILRSVFRGSGLLHMLN